MISFLALYRGRSLAEAELVGVTTDRELVAHAASGMLQARESRVSGTDPAIAAMDFGRRRALELVREESEGARP